MELERNLVSTNLRRLIVNAFAIASILATIESAPIVNILRENKPNELVDLSNSSTSYLSEQTDEKFGLYLQKYGYIKKHKDGALSVTKETFSSAIKDFQEMAGLEITGVLDGTTLAKMESPRCGNPDKKKKNRSNLSSKPVALSRGKRFVLEGSWHRSLRVSYKINKYPSRYNKSTEEVDVQIKRAFDLWSDIAHINFTKTDGKADINIYFYPPRHPDCDNIFDGPGSELGHAFSPEDESDVHFDDQENWTINKADGTDIFTVAAHEFGHALGISHSPLNQSLMAPYYKYVQDMKLDGDDVAAIQELYGVRATKAAKEDDEPKDPSPRGVPTNDDRSNNEQDSPDLCQNSSIDAITRTQDGSTYVFKGEFYWLLQDDGFAKFYPRLIAKDWPGLPSSLDAALTYMDGKTIFFKGDKYWHFVNRKPDSGYPKSINVGFQGIPADIDAAFMYNRDKYVYFFKGDKYWRFDYKAKIKVSSHYPRLIADYWSGIPSNLSDVFTWDNNQTFFFKEDEYYRFDEKEDEVDRKADPPFPRPSAYWWFGCGASTMN